MQTLQEPIMHRCMPFLHVALTARLSKPWVGVGLLIPTFAHSSFVHARGGGGGASSPDVR